MIHKAGCFIFLMINILTVSAAELRFNEHGEMLAPDLTYLERGLDSQERGHYKDAMRYFKRSARFGNPYAQSAIAFMHMQNGDYLSALAWFNLVDLKMIDRDETIVRLMTELGAHLTDSDQQRLNQLNDQLNVEYGKQASLVHREDWKSNLSIGGSRIKGHIPGRVKIYPAGRIEQRGFGEAEILVSAAFVTGEAVRLQMKEFIYDYEVKFTSGKVSLQDVEFLEKDKPI